MHELCVWEPHCNSRCEAGDIAAIESCGSRKIVSLGLWALGSSLQGSCARALGDGPAQGLFTFYATIHATIHGLTFYATIQIATSCASLLVSASTLHGPPCLHAPSDDGLGSRLYLLYELLESHRRSRRCVVGVVLLSMLSMCYYILFSLIYVVDCWLSLIFCWLYPDMFVGFSLYILLILA
mgnify:FL=1